MARNSVTEPKIILPMPGWGEHQRIVPPASHSYGSMIGFARSRLYKHTSPFYDDLRPSFSEADTSDTISAYEKQNMYPCIHDGQFVPFCDKTCVKLPQSENEEKLWMVLENLRSGRGDRPSFVESDQKIESLTQKEDIPNSDCIDDYEGDDYDEMNYEERSNTPKLQPVAYGTSWREMQNDNRSPRRQKVCVSIQNPQPMSDPTRRARSSFVSSSESPLRWSNNSQDIPLLGLKQSRIITDSACGQDEEVAIVDSFNNNDLDSKTDFQIAEGFRLLAGNLKDTASPEKEKPIQFPSPESRKLIEDDVDFRRNYWQEYHSKRKPRTHLNPEGEFILVNEAHSTKHIHTRFNELKVQPPAKKIEFPKPEFDPLSDTTLNGLSFIAHKAKTASPEPVDDQTNFIDSQKRVTFYGVKGTGSSPSLGAKPRREHYKKQKAKSRSKSKDNKTKNPPAPAIIACQTTR